MSSRTKGNRSRRRAIEYYEAEGWLVDVVEKTGKFIVNKDLFSPACDGFDLICLKNNHVKMVQVKTNNPPKQGTYIDFAKQYAGQNVSFDGWTWYDREGILLQQYNPDGSITRVDMRKSNGKSKKETN